ncbi:hypothetical protein AVEN_224680-1 [Araneus ventricosus]|uniref:Uncharacterized protein n=1 Tax=Araneus ventricosus TaxID=182803 RepID=A0A4Y2LRL0_ARAVE|nr:hypothetical protein AVEN_224680-1 [Araneus ventricosus]
MRSSTGLKDCTGFHPLVPCLSGSSLLGGGTSLLGGGSSLLGILTKEGTFSGVEGRARTGIGFLLREILGSLGRKEEEGLLNFRGGSEGFSFLPESGGLFKAGGLQSSSLASLQSQTYARLALLNVRRSWLRLNDVKESSSY